MPNSSALDRLAALEDFQEAGFGLLRVLEGGEILFEEVTGSQADEAGGGFVEGISIAKGSIDEFEPAFLSHEEDAGVHAGEHEVEALEGALQRGLGPAALDRGPGAVNGS